MSWIYSYGNFLQMIDPKMRNTNPRLVSPRNVLSKLVKTSTFKHEQCVTECFRVLLSVTESYRVLESISSASTWTNLWACLMLKAWQNASMFTSAFPLLPFTLIPGGKVVLNWEITKLIVSFTLRLLSKINILHECHLILHDYFLHLAIQIQECELLRLVDIPLQESFIPTPRTPISKTKKFT